MRFAEQSGILSKWASAQQTVEKPGRARGGRSPLELSIEPSGVYGGRGAILSQGNPISRRENSFLTSFAAGTRRGQAKLAWGCLHSYNDTVSVNAGVIIEHCFRGFPPLEGVQILKPHYFHSIRFFLPFLCFSFLCPKYKCPFISGFPRVNTERLLQ